MAFEGLTEKLQGALRKLSSKGKLTEQSVKEGMREVRMALLEADVNYAVAKDFIKKVTERCIGQEITTSLTASQQVISIVRDEMTQLMGGQNAKLTWSSSPLTVYMLCGLQGAGKTTMLSIMSNQNPATGGMVSLDGENIWENRKALDTAMADCEKMGFATQIIDGYAGHADLGEGDDYEALAILAHLESCRRRLLDYASGKISEIPELSEQILPYGDEKKSIYANQYRDMVNLFYMLVTHRINQNF